MLRPAQIRAARALLGWRQEDLSKVSGVGTATIYRIEKSNKSITGYASTLVRIQAALEQAGIEFIDNDDIGDTGFGFQKGRGASRHGPRPPVPATTAWSGRTCKYYPVVVARLGEDARTYKETIEALDYPDLEDKEQRVTEIAAARTLLQSARVRMSAHMPLNWNFPAKIGPKTGRQVHRSRSPRGHYLVPAFYSTKKYPLSEIPASIWERGAYAFTADDVHYYRQGSRTCTTISTALRKNCATGGSRAH